MTWLNLRLRPMPVRWPRGESRVTRIVGIRVGGRSLGGIRGTYRSDGA